MGTEEIQERIAEHHEASWAWALVCCRRDRAEAEDVLQEAYLKLVSGRARFEGRSSFKTFLFSVIRVTAHERHRKRTKRSMLLGRWSHRVREDESVPASQRDHVDSNALRGVVLEALESLSGKQRQILELVFYHALSVEEAAGVMEMKLGTARTHYARGKARMVSALDAHPRFEWEPT